MPIDKNSGDVHTKSSYRPKSVIGQIAKIVDQLMRTKLDEY